MLLDLGVVLLNAVHETLSCLGEGQVKLVALELEVVLFLEKLSLLFTEVLSALLEGVLLEAVFGSLEALGDFLELLALDADLVLKLVVLVL